MQCIFIACQPLPSYVNPCINMLYYTYFPFLPEQGAEEWVLNCHPAASHWHDLLLPTCSGCACRPQEEGEWKRVHFLSHPFQRRSKQFASKPIVSSREFAAVLKCASAEIQWLLFSHVIHNLVRNFPLQFLEELIMALCSITLSSKHSPHLNLCQLQICVCNQELLST